MASEKLLLPLLLLSLVVLDTISTADQARRGRRAEEKHCVDVGVCYSQAQWASMCGEAAGYDFHAIYCSVHLPSVAGQCCCVQTEH